MSISLKSMDNTRVWCGACDCQVRIKLYHSYRQLQCMKVLTDMAGICSNTICFKIFTQSCTAETLIIFLCGPPQWKKKKVVWQYKNTIHYDYSSEFEENCLGLLLQIYFPIDYDTPDSSQLDLLVFSHYSKTENIRISQVTHIRGMWVVFYNAQQNDLARL